MKLDQTTMELGEIVLKVKRLGFQKVLEID